MRSEIDGQSSNRSIVFDSYGVGLSRSLSICLPIFLRSSFRLRSVGIVRILNQGFSAWIEVRRFQEIGIAVQRDLQGARALARLRQRAWTKFGRARECSVARLKPGTAERLWREVTWCTSENVWGLSR
jgi:hypothetical protein